MYRIFQFLHKADRAEIGPEKFKWQQNVFILHLHCIAFALHCIYFIKSKRFKTRIQPTLGISKNKIIDSISKGG